MKKVLCFGDSNTYGFNPTNGKRYDASTRWTSILQELVGEKFKIIEAGCNNRTAFKINPEGIRQTGIEILPTYLLQNPDIIIIALGTNDLQTQYNITLEEYSDGLTQLITLAKDKKIILLTPTIITSAILDTFFNQLFDKNSIEKSKELPAIYEKIAKENQCTLINSNDFINGSTPDGLHYTPEEHKVLAEVFANILLNTFQRG